jgi:ABC-type lipoprotein export system ATPase subunit
MALIEIKNLHKSYFSDGVETPVLKGLDFSIDKGEFVAIMGPSGSGKSTLMHVLGMLDRQTSGDYLFENQEAAKLSDEELAGFRARKLGFVFQAYNLLARTSVLENVKLPLFYSNIPESEWNQLARRAIKEVGLGRRQDFRPSQLSGGEQQRTAIARALVMSPEVIFADEPTGNLDSQTGYQVMEVFQKLNREKNHTIILVTHEADIAVYAQRIIKIKDGRIESDQKKS